MRKFLKRTALYLLLLMIAVYGLDFAYTFINVKSTVRNKVQFVINSPPKHYDAIIIGSSRAEDHIVTEMFEKQGLTAYNLGMSGANLCETSLLLKLFFEKGNTADKIVLQLDLNYQSEEPAEGIMAVYLPYLPINKTIANHYAEADNAFAMRYVPFYRYAKFDSKIGFREIAMTLLRKKDHLMKTDGFSALAGELTSKEVFELPTAVAAKNKYYTEIVSTCKQHNAALISIETPFCNYVSNGDFFAKLKQKLPEIYDYSHVVTQDSCFSSCGHMNEAGARIFTAFLLKEHFNLPDSPKD